MCSAEGGPAQADLTAQAKIRNAAITCFVRDGFQKASLRAIAAEAGASPALIFHHFGSKEGLRVTCDEHVLQVLTGRARAAGRSAGMQDLLGVYLADPEEYRLYVQYMARAIQEDVPAARTFVQTMVAESEAVFTAGTADGAMHQSSDPRAFAVLNVLISMAVLTMAPSFARTLGHEEFGPEVLRRMTVPALELYTRGLYTDDTILEAAKDAWRGTRPPQQEED